MSSVVVVSPVDCLVSGAAVLSLPVKITIAAVSCRHRMTGH